MIRRNTIFLISILSTFVCCESLDDSDPGNLNGILDLNIENNNSPADGISTIKVIAVLRDDFNTEEDGKVDFTIFKDAIENESKDIVFTSIDGEDRKISEIQVSNGRIRDIEISAAISANGSRVSKDTIITFTRAFPDSINVFSNVLSLTSGSFDQIDITTELARTIGTVNIKSIAETTVVDTLGNEIGVFSNYNNQTDTSGKITNKYSLAGREYLGKLYAIATASNANNMQLVDTITVFTIPKE